MSEYEASKIAYEQEIVLLKARHQAEYQKRMLDYMAWGVGFILQQRLQMIAGIILNTNITNAEALELLEKI